MTTVPRRRAWPSALILIAGLAVVVVWALGTGPFPLPWQQAINVLLSPSTLSPAEHSVLFTLRLPRVLAALVVGSGLAVAGCVFQAVLRNPLADPGFIGVSGGAAVAAAACLAGLGQLAALPVAPQLLVSLAALAGGIGSAVLVIRIARVDGQTQAVTLLLAGLAINALAGGLLGLIAYTANDPTLRAITLWLFGSLARAGWPELVIGAPAIVIGIILLWRLTPSLNALLLGDAEAGHLGVDVRRLRIVAIGLAVLCTAIAVALAGIIGFVGLMVPHMLRLWIGPDHRRLLPLSALGGALLLAIADTMARAVVQPAEIPVGIVCALLGAPFFLGLLLRDRRLPELV
ncbi:FecCD family ABC transporter permease [Solimonas marina]|uniref:Iron ABC transporter permease n=1 Tax=Solimonas marina TaxID=2714601 RepID=A0A969WA07_9GAMM|nr:iron ABC transporter permease [Solimonas marina]NKF23402.1 iron ABC transporter permease [Solimonas marina]